MARLLRPVLMCTTPLTGNEPYFDGYLNPLPPRSAAKTPRPANTREAFREFLARYGNNKRN